jgi:uroporphyrinogen decarboxylase
MSHYCYGEMNPSQRWRAIIRGDPVDRVPVFPWAFGHGAILLGYSNLGDLYAKPEVAYKAQTISRELYGWDQPLMFWSPSWGITEYGGKSLFPYNPKMMSVTMVEPAVKTPEDAEKLEVPDPGKDPNMIEAMKWMKKSVEKREMPMFFLCGGWLTNLDKIVEIQTVMRWLRKEPSLIKKLLAKTVEFAVRQTELLVKEMGADTWIAMDFTPTDSNTLISPKTFGDIVVPYATAAHQKVLDLGVPMWVTHYCSNQNGNILAGHIDKIPLGKPGVIHFGPEVDMKLVVEKFGKKHIVMGNVDPPSIMLQPYDEVVRLCKVDIEKGMHSPKGYMLGVGCELPPRTPVANVYAIMKAAREYGRY